MRIGLLRERPLDKHGIFWESFFTSLSCTVIKGDTIEDLAGRCDLILTIEFTLYEYDAKNEPASMKRLAKSFGATNAEAKRAYAKAALIRKAYELEEIEGRQ